MLYPDYDRNHLCQPSVMSQKRRALYKGGACSLLDRQLGGWKGAYFSLEMTEGKVKDRILREKATKYDLLGRIKELLIIEVTISGLKVSTYEGSRLVVG